MSQNSNGNLDQPKTPLRLGSRALVFATNVRRSVPEVTSGTLSNKGAVVGAIGGAVVCAVVAVLASLRYFPSAWFEPFVTVGPSYSAMNGAAIGATFGAFFGALMGIFAKSTSGPRAGKAERTTIAKPRSGSSTAVRLQRIFSRHTRATRLHDARVAKGSARLAPA